MSSQKVGSIKIPPFDKENYGLWKKKMTLFIKAANPLYMGIMDNGPFVPQKLIPESVTETGEGFHKSLYLRNHRNTATRKKIKWH